MTGQHTEVNMYRNTSNSNIQYACECASVSELLSCVYFLAIDRLSERVAVSEPLYWCVCVCLSLYGCPKESICVKLAMSVCLSL